MMLKMPLMSISTQPAPTAMSSIAIELLSSSTLKPGRMCSLPNTLPYTKPNSTALQPTAASMRPSHMPRILNM